jgi:beta-mannosidase
MPDASAAPTASQFPGRPRLLGVSTHERRLLNEGWSRCSTSRDAATTVDALDALAAGWCPAIVPGTVAASLRHDGRLDLETAPDFDATDWWYRCRFSVDAANGARDVLCFDGLATLAEVWLNGSQILASDNMFLAHEVDVTAMLARENDLAIRFRSLRGALAARRPRPKWRTKLVEDQQLRWHRTTLLGRMPGWSPPVRAVGPWRAVRLERRTILDVVSGDVYPSVNDSTAAVDVSLSLGLAAGVTVRGARLEVGGERSELRVVTQSEGQAVVSGTTSLDASPRWWPHTHGEQPRIAAAVVVDTSAGPVRIDFGMIALRSVTADVTGDGFELRINGAPVFCRGACWTTPDIVALTAPEAVYRELLTLARDAGMNMLRVGGTMVYEADCFYDICDELGILVWQEFMFANMDYPADDAAFMATVDREASDTLARLRRHASVAVLCGNSEVEQQAAMLGADRALWSNAIFRELLPTRCAGMPGVPYVPASPTGGALPFHVDSGIAHYFGVGACLRPLEDARRSNVRFASECLGFSNVPEQSAVDVLLPRGEAPFHHPRWKLRVPRDQGAGWDFEDVRDFYLARLFDVDPLQVRYADPERYLALSRVTTGEVMARTIGEWRRAGSTCHGALIWFFQDLWLGAGWGLVDADRRPKAAYYAVKRAMQPVALAMTDEGANGVDVHLVNDRATTLTGDLHLALYRSGGTLVAHATMPVEVLPRTATRLRGDAIFGRFEDLAYAYRFGPLGFDVMVATLRDASSVVADAVYFRHSMSIPVADEPLIAAYATRASEDVVEIHLGSSRFAQAVALQCDDFVPDDSYFHMAPGSERTVRARATKPGGSFSGYAQALNASSGVNIPLKGDRSGGRGGASA